MATLLSQRIPRCSCVSRIPVSTSSWASTPQLSRSFSLTSRSFTPASNSSGGGPKPPTPSPAPHRSSTSALDYKLNHPRVRPPPLPTIDPPKWSAEEAVTNILYNTPPPSNQPFTRHVLNALVQNEPGVLSRVSGTLAGRGFNIDSLVVCATEIKDLSRMCIVLRGQDAVIEQARRQLEDLVPVWAVLDYTRTKTIERELLLTKISILGPEYFEDQLAFKIEESRMSRAAMAAGRSLNEDDFQAEREMESMGETIAEGSPARETIERTREAAEHAYPPHHHNATGSDAASPSPSKGYRPAPPYEHLSPSEALRQKHTHLLSLQTLTSQFSGKVVDISHDSIVVEVSGKTSRIDAFLKLVRPYGILEAARSGAMVMPRAPIESEWSGLADEETEDLAEAVDASLLPPG